MTTDEKLTELAKFSLDSAERFDEIADIFYSRLEVDLAEGRFDRANLLRCELEQERAVFADAKTRRQRLRQLFGLPISQPTPENAVSSSPRPQ